MFIHCPALGAQVLFCVSIYRGQISTRFAAVHVRPRCQRTWSLHVALGKQPHFVSIRQPGAAHVKFAQSLMMASCTQKGFVAFTLSIGGVKLIARVVLLPLFE